MYKKAGCRCKVVVLLIETYWFFDVLASVAVVVAKKLVLACSIRTYTIYWIA